MVEVSATLRRRVDPVALTGLVAAGDVLLIALWVAIGEYQHGFPVTAFPLRYLSSLAPFLIGWAVTAFVGGLYTRDAWEFPIRAVSWTVPAWVTAVLIAQPLREFVFHGNWSVAFALVSMGVGLALLVPFRAAVSLLAK